MISKSCGSKIRRLVVDSRDSDHNSLNREFVDFCRELHPVSGGAGRCFIFGRGGCFLSMKGGLVEASEVLGAFRTFYHILVP